MKTSEIQVGKTYGNRTGTRRRKVIDILLIWGEPCVRYTEKKFDETNTHNMLLKDFCDWSCCEMDELSIDEKKRKAKQ